MADAPATPALDAWYEAHPGTDRDTARIVLPFPHQAPEVYVHITYGGCDDPPRLTHPGNPTMTLRLGPVQIEGFIDELERYAAAITEVVAHARWQADSLTVGEGSA